MCIRDRAGSSPGVGVTHFTVLLGNYMTGVMGRKTAVLEWNTSGAFGEIQEIYSTRTVTNRQDQTFITYGVSYYKNAGRKELLECQLRFDTVILDFGTYNGKVEEELLRCDRKFFLGSFSEWRLRVFSEHISDKRVRDCGWEYFAAFGNKETAGMIKRFLKVQVSLIPWLPDAFVITGEAMAFFERLLKYKRDGN